MKIIRNITLATIMLLGLNYIHAGALLTVTLGDSQLSKITWQCADVTECVELIITRVEEHGSCDERVQEIKISKTFIEGFDEKPSKAK